MNAASGLLAFSGLMLIFGPVVAGSMNMPVVARLSCLGWGVECTAAWLSDAVWWSGFFLAMALLSGVLGRALARREEQFHQDAYEALPDD